MVMTLLAGADRARADGAPEARVPCATATVELDGRVTDAEWSDAAVVSDLRLRGTKQRLQPRTRFYLKHENNHLLVGVRCFERDPAYPRASRRDPTDLLTADDAVQVIIGTANRLAVAPEILKVGGYPGAMDERGPRPDHYYAFTVNAAGSRSRTYNEGTLRRPLFEAAARRTEGAWTVEMRIPFASAGIDEPTAEPLYANLYRFRPPEMAGWHSRSFGGYVPMPFGTLRILPKGRESDRTVETIDDEIAEDSAAPPLSVKLGWYPLARRVAADVTGPKRLEEAAISLQMKGVPSKHAAMAADGRARVILDVPPESELPAEAELVVTTPEGNVIHREVCALTPVERPEWLGTEVAKQYVAHRVPKPWTPPTVSDNVVRLEHARLTFGSHGFFESVSGAAGELLAGQGEIVLRKEGREVTLAPDFTKFSRRAASVRIDTALRFDGGTVELRADVDYDGFTICKLRVRDLPPEKIETLSVRIPLRKANARFVHRFHVQGTRALTGAGWEGDAGPAWVGGQDAGLAFNFDVDPFLSVDRRRQIEVIEEKAQSWLRINLVDAPGQVVDEDHVFRFFLLPTPTKEPSIRKDGFFHTSMGGWFENWSDYQGYPDLAKLPQVRKRADAAHAKGLPFILYFNMMLAENAPGFARHRPELIIPPGLMWYKREYNPGKGIPCWVCCPRGPYGDLLLHGMSKLTEEGDIDGVYMDGTSLAWDCDNPAHAPCAGTKLSWDEEPLTPLVATRNFVKRIRGIFDVKGEPMLVAHNGGGLQIETLSLCDVFYEGEQLSDVRYARGYRLPLHKAAVGYSGRPWGFRTDLIANMIRPRYMMAYAALHDVEIARDDEDLETAIYGDFQDDATSYHPYWRAQPHIRLEDGEVLVSYYLRPGSAMLIVSNLTWDHQDVVLNVRDLFPDQALTKAVNVERREPVAIDRGRVSMRIPRHRFVALRIEPGAAANTSKQPATDSTFPAPATGIDRYIPDQWRLNTDTPGVTVEDDVNLGNARRGPKLASTLHHDVAEARLRVPLGRTLTVRLLVQASGRLGLKLGATKIVVDGGRMKFDGLDPWNEGRTLSPEWRRGVAEEIVFSVDNGVLNAAWAGQPLAVNVSVAVPKDGYGLSLWTWAGDWFAFDVLEISGRPTSLFERAGTHPVR